MKPIFPFILAGLLAAGPAFAQTAPTTTLDGIAAVVDEDVILRSELDRAVANITAQYASQPGQLPPRDILEKQVLERLILMHLQIGRAADSGIQISDAELQQAVAAVAGQNKMTVDQLRQRLAAENLNFDEFRNNLRDEVTVQRLRQRYIQSKVTISEAEIDQLLATQKIGGEELRLANIQIALPDGATPDQIAVASKKVLEIKGMVERGELDFHSAAIRFSQGQNALDGGELGWRTYDAIPPLFASVLRGMKPGQITDPVRGPNGFQIVQLEESRQPQPQKITQFKALDITPQFISSLSAAGYSNLTADQLVQFAALKISPDFIRGFSQAGFKNLDVDELVQLKALNITPEFIRSLEAHGLHPRTADQLVKLKMGLVD